MSSKINITNQIILDCEKEIDQLTEEYEQKLEQLKEKIRSQKATCDHESIILPSHGYTIKQCTKCGESSYE